MSIRVVCPNGHALVVKDSLAGKSGLCPKCKAQVEVPEPPHGELSEDAIMGILGPPGAEPLLYASVEKEAEPVEAPLFEGERSSPPKKSCHKCNQEISAGIHICPHCHTYIAGLTDF
jgi:hypothetical protein